MNRPVSSSQERFIAGAVMVVLLASALQATVFASSTPPFTATYPTIPQLATALAGIVAVASGLIIVLSRPPADRIAIAALGSSFVVAISTEPLESLVALAPILALFLAAPQLRRPLVGVWAIRFLVAVFLIGILLLPVFAWTLRGNRIQGLFSNPNSAGAAAYFLAYLAAQRAQPMTLFLAVAIAALSGSRNFLAAVIVVMIGWWWEKRREPAQVARLKRARTVAMTTVAVLLASFVLTEPSFARTASRLSAWKFGLDAAWEEFPLGVGYSVYDVEISSSPLLIAVELGAFGILVAVSIYATLSLRILQDMRSRRFLRAGFVGAAVATSISEGWMFASGSFVFIWFWILYLQGDDGRDHHEAADRRTARLGRA